MTTFSGLFKKAHEAINNLRGVNSFFIGKDGDIVFSKNNVCVHEVIRGEEGIAESADDEESIQHTPGYMTIHCQSDEQTGVTLVLQWLPNATLEKNPASIRSVSPRGNNANRTPSKTKLPELRKPGTLRKEDDESSETVTQDSGGDATSDAMSPDICVEMNGDVITVTSAVTDRPHSLPQAIPKLSGGEGSGGLFVPSINVIPNTPVDTLSPQHDEDNKSTISNSSVTTSGADEMSEKEDLGGDESSECDNDSESELETTGLLAKYREECATLFSSTPEQFALEHNLALTEPGDETTSDEASVAVSRGRSMYQTRASNASLFSVNLGKMRSMRLFFSNPECTSGQLVIASPDSHYKILHFHHGGMDKLAQLFEQWSAIKTKSVKEGSPLPTPDRHLMICHPEVSKTELDPEDGLYERVNWEFWKSYKNRDGQITDSATFRKAIYFASMDAALRKEIWPFLLRVYPWESTLEQREQIRNDLFLEYQNIRKKRMKRSLPNSKNSWASVECTISKDVVRTDRKNPYYAGDDNPNVEIMKNILLNYAAMYPEINYIQGMSDLLAPLLSTIRDEADTYWCFDGLMQQTLFVTKNNANLMELNLEYLRELLKLLAPDFFNYLRKLGGDALQLMFVHRWILLFFKREFPEADALHIWEACWARYRTSFFHLFVCVAIVSIYGKDVMAQQLPHDEILLYFSSLAMHMDARIVLKKARGLLYEFNRMERLPCTLAGVCECEQMASQWDSHRLPQTFECVQMHGESGDEPCPFSG